MKSFLRRCSDWTKFVSMALVYDRLGADASYCTLAMTCNCDNLRCLASWGIEEHFAREWPHWPPFLNMTWNLYQVACNM